MERPTSSELAWRATFYGLSALMAALALVDLSAARLAHALGDAGVTCLLLSLMSQYPFVRAFLQASERPDGREVLLKEAERLRKLQPWTARLSSTGWALMFTSLLLRLAGAQ